MKALRLIFSALVATVVAGSADAFTYQTTVISDYTVPQIEVQPAYQVEQPKAPRRGFSEAVFFKMCRLVLVAKKAEAFLM